MRFWQSETGPGAGLRRFLGFRAFCVLFWLSELSQLPIDQRELKIANWQSVIDRARKPSQNKPSKFRRFWDLAPGTAFLNHGSFGACPRDVLARQAELRRRMEAEPVQFLWRRYEELLDPSRRILASYVGANARDVVFVTNAT